MPRFRPLIHAAALAAAFVGALFAAAAAQDFSREDIEQIVHDYLMENPQVILDAVQALDARRRAAEANRQSEAISALRDELLYGPSIVVAGNPDGDVTIVEFFDYNCPYCKRSAPALMGLIEEDPGLRLAMVEWPILAEDSIYAARAALAAERQGLYLEMHEALMERRGPFTQDVVRSVAADLGLDFDRLLVDMEAPEIDDAIQRNHELAAALGVSGTPTFIIGDALAPGAIDIDEMRDMVDRARGDS